MSRNYVKTILLAYDTAGAQYTTVGIAVPFPVKRVIFHPPYTHVLAADAKNESYAIQSTLNPYGPTIGVFSGVSGLSNQTNKDPITIDYAYPIDINSVYTFIIRGLVEVAGGAAAPITAKIVLTIEFRE